MEHAISEEVEEAIARKLAIPPSLHGDHPLTATAGWRCASPPLTRWSRAVRAAGAGLRPGWERLRYLERLGLIPAPRSSCRSAPFQARCWCRSTAPQMLALTWPPNFPWR